MRRSVVLVRQYTSSSVTAVAMVAPGLVVCQALFTFACTSSDPAPGATLDAMVSAEVDGGSVASSGSVHEFSSSTSSASTAATVAPGVTATTTSGTSFEPAETTSVHTATTTAHSSNSVTTVSASTTSATADDSTNPVPPSGVVGFEPAGGTFVGTQTVLLTAASGKTIHYTLDGSVPDATSTRYESPIELDATAVLRTFVPDGDGLTSGVYAAQPYVELLDDVRDFSSNLPLIVINRHGDVPLEVESNELRSASVLVFEPGDDGRTQLLGQASLATRAGVRYRGAFSRYFPQRSYAVETWAAGTDDDESMPFLGMPKESDWVLSAPSEMDRALMRNRFAMDVSREIGQHASRAQFVEVFVVDTQDETSLGTSHYMGAYTVLEKIKRDAARVDVQKLDVTDVSEDTISGGYIFRIDRDTHFSAGGFDFGWVYPEPESMATSERAPQLDYLRNYLDEFFTSLTSDDFAHPVTTKHYSEYIDVDSFIDHNLVTALTKNVDGLRLSAYFYKQRDQRVVAGPVWDFDRSLGTPHDERAVRPDEWAIDDGTDPLSWGFWDDLFRDPTFAAAYWERWQELRSSSFEIEHLVAKIDAYEAELTEARVRHFDRWQELPPSESAAYEVELIRTWLAARVEWIDTQRP